MHTRREIIFKIQHQNFVFVLIHNITVARGFGYDGNLHVVSHGKYQCISTAASSLRRHRTDLFCTLHKQIFFIQVVVPFMLLAHTTLARTAIHVAKFTICLLLKSFSVPHRDDIPKTSAQREKNDYVKNMTVICLIMSSKSTHFLPVISATRL